MRTKNTKPRIGKTDKKIAKFLQKTKQPITARLIADKYEFSYNGGKYYLNRLITFGVLYIDEKQALSIQSPLPTSFI